MPTPQYTERAADAINTAVKCCTDRRNEFITPEHLLFALLDNYEFQSMLYQYGDTNELSKQLSSLIDDMEQVPSEQDYHPEPSAQLTQLLGEAFTQVAMSSAKAVDIIHLVHAMLKLEDSYACYVLTKFFEQQDTPQTFMSELINWYELMDSDTPPHFGDHQETDDDDEELDDLFEDDEDDGESAPRQGHERWRQLVVCLNDVVAQKNPLIGREAELERTIQVLCRREKNNPLHVGEPGVGKTALVYGLTQRIVKGNVPPRLKGSKVYQLDLGTLLAGTQFRGDFEKRIKQVMDGVTHEAKNNIVYIDEIHNLVGAGAVGESSMDASNMLKPYLESGNIRFIGSTTYEEYNKHFSRSKGLVRRFQQIDIAEPSVEETINILKQLRPLYEEFHSVVYEDAALETAAKASAKYINDRFLPDKAIDLIDEAGAAVEAAPAEAPSGAIGGALRGPAVSASLILDILAKTCKVEALAMKEDDDNTQQETLSERMLASIYGQDEAIRQVVEAVQMAKAGLMEDDKPLASLLFVGPTGVGKTEVARVLARELGIELQRFDMSEYTEKHTVAKLIGSPAGYVGYEDGGLLTDAIRKTPNCVLLLDEIEKAHQDIYNILLQVMDYARLTDNKGRRADFRNVIIIMTSNAGAQYASQASIGFGQRVERGEAMLRQVKKTFKPEFINRLSATVVFHDMDRQMATLILRKKLGELQQKLTARQVQMTLTDEVFEQLLSEGFTREYGAREMDRVIAQRLKPMLMREILFGSLRKGGAITIDHLPSR
ncbi:MAG: AAA family ATPase [Prevotella sp.]|nr:AAA family ATPase [Prevotella sp.]